MRLDLSSAAAPDEQLLKNELGKLQSQDNTVPRFVPPPPAPTISAPMQGGIVEVVMTRDKDCKGSVRFATPDEKAAITNVYVSRSMAGINGAKSIRVALEVMA
jgi:hypothetical protein